MTEKNGDGSDQLDFDAEAHKQELERHLNSSFDEASPADLIKAQLEHMRESANDDARTDSLPINVSEELSIPGLIEWAQNNGLLPKAGEPEGEYLSRIRLARFKSQKNKQSPSINNMDKDQKNLF